MPQAGDSDVLKLLVARKASQDYPSCNLIGFEEKLLHDTGKEMSPHFHSDLLDAPF